MAILPVIERAESKAIISILLKEALTAKEMNEIVVLQQSICSTSTLYRRLSELTVASFLRKDDKARYQLTDLGKEISQKLNEMEQTKNIRLTTRHQKILSTIAKISIKRNISSGEIYKLSSASPNEVSKILKYLLMEGYIHRINISSGSGKRGRPKYEYILTKKGKIAINEITELYKQLER